MNPGPGQRRLMAETVLEVLPCIRLVAGLYDHRCLQGPPFLSALEFSPRPDSSNAVVTLSAIFVHTCSPFIFFLFFVCLGGGGGGVCA